MITQETKLVKPWGGFDLAILKVKSKSTRKNRSSHNKTYKPLHSTSYYYLPEELTDTTTCKLRIHGLFLSLAFAKHKHPCLWLWDPTQWFSNINSPVYDSKTTIEGLDHQHIWWLEKAATSTTSDLEILQGIIPAEDIRKLFRNRTLNTKEAHSFLSEKPHKNMLRISFIYWEK